VNIEYIGMLLTGFEPVQKNISWALVHIIKKILFDFRNGYIVFQIKSFTWFVRPGKYGF
jgi:hypothetical protein